MNSGVKAKETRTEFPEVSEQTFRTRAGNGFDLALNQAIRMQFSQRPPKAEMDLLQQNVNRFSTISDGAERLTNALLVFMENNPDAMITRYYKASHGDTSWLVTPTGTLGFNAKKLADTIRGVVSPSKEVFISALAELSNPSNQKKSVSLGELEPTLANVLQLAMVQQLGAGKNQLPVAFEYDPDSMVLTVLSKLAARITKFDQKDMGG